MRKWAKIVAIMGICTWIGSQSMVPAQAAQMTAEFELTDDNRYASKYYQPLVAEYESGQLARAGSAQSVSTELEDTLIRAWKGLESSIDLSEYQISPEDIGTYYNQVLNAHPELFYVTGAFRYSYNYNGIVSSVMPEYIGDFTQAEIDEALSQMESLSKEAVSLVTDDMDDYEKVLVVHDWLATYCAYDYENLLAGSVPDISHTSYGALINREAVCDGYSKAFVYILQKELSIPCYIASSEAMVHAWNLVEINDNYYHVDVTWDDPVWDKLGRVSHSYFLLSDSEISDSTLNNPHYGWDSSLSATDTTYANALFRNSNSRMIPHGGNWYYTTFSDKSSRLVQTDNLLNDTAEQIYDIGLWMAGESSYFGDSYAYLTKYKNQLIFNGPKAIYYMPLDTKEVAVLYTPAQEDIDAADENIYGFTMEGKTLYYAVQTSPGIEGSQSNYVKEVAYPLPETISGGVSITGTLRYKEVLTASVSFDEDVDGDISYQWYRDGQEIAGETKESYILTANDIGTIISVKVTVSDYLLELYGQSESEIGKAIPQGMTETIEADGYRGDTLAAITLPDGYTFIDETQIMEKVGSFTYEASYCPEEELYERISPIMVTVHVICKEHDWDEGTETKAATTEEEGIKTHTCKYCTETKEEEIPKLTEPENSEQIPDEEEPTVSDNTTPEDSDKKEEEPAVSDNTTSEDSDREEEDTTIPDDSEQTPETPDTGEQTPETPDANASASDETTKQPENNVSTPVEGTKQPEQKPNPAPPTSEETPNEPEEIVLKKGMTFTDEKTQNKYKITKLSGDTAEVAFVGTANSKAQKLTIPATIFFEGKTFKVTSIAKNALKNHKKLTSLTIGTNVKKIEANAFSGCKKLKKITIKSTKIKNFGKNCIKNIHKKAQIKCPKSKRTYYKKKLTKKTGWQKNIKII